MVYKEGDGVEPIAYISVKSGISEKSFHYEIISWVADNGNLYIRNSNIISYVLWMWKPSRRRSAGAWSS
jgi:hypothetical protein